MNTEARMENRCASDFGIGASFVIRHAGFVISLAARFFATCAGLPGLVSDDHLTNS